MSQTNFSQGGNLQNLVVLIEDDGSLRQNLEYLLRAERIRCMAVADGMSGFALIRRSRPKVVILDMYVPHRSGFEILDDIRDDPTLAPIFVIAMTGMAEDDEELRGMKGRADVILQKPINEAWLLDLIREGLDQAGRPDRTFSSRSV